VSWYAVPRPANTSPSRRRSAGGDAWPGCSRAWRRWDDIVGIFAQPAYEQWARDRDLLDHRIKDPWQER
jgi:hypothetical protein